jgi:hypothetical protein
MNSRRDVMNKKMNPQSALIIARFLALMILLPTQSDRDKYENSLDVESVIVQKELTTNTKEHHGN